MVNTRRTILLCLLSFCVSALAAQSPRQLAQEILADKKLDTVYARALALLQKGFAAGDGYPQVWIRDMNTFIEASCKVYDHAVIRESLVNFLRLQQPNGEIVDGYVLKGHVSWNDPNIYTSPADTLHVGFKNTVETDQESSLIQAIGKYIQVTGDSSMLDEIIAGKSVRERLALALYYLMHNRYSSKYGLIIGATTQDWGDVQVEGGAVVDIDSNTHWCADVYDNAMLVIALKHLINFAASAEEKTRWQLLERSIFTHTRKWLWDVERQKFIPHLYISASPFPNSFNENAIHFHGGTAIAIEAGLLSKKEIETVNGQMVKNVQLAGAQSIGLTLHPPYPDGIIKNSNSNKPYVYQNGGDWTWFGGRMIQQLIRNGLVREAYDELQPMIDREIKQGIFYEWYKPGGKPSGSADFKGSAGVLAQAISLLNDWAQAQLAKQ